MFGGDFPQEKAAKIGVLACYLRTLAAPARGCDDGSCNNDLAGGFGGKHTAREGS